MFFFYRGRGFGLAKFRILGPGRARVQHFFKHRGRGPAGFDQNNIYRGRGRVCRKITGLERGRGQGRAPGRVLGLENLRNFISHCFLFNYSMHTLSTFIPLGGFSKDKFSEPRNTYQ